MPQPRPKPACPGPGYVPHSRARFIFGAEPHEGCAKKVSKSSFSTTSANICKPGFSIYPSTTNHDVGSTTIILLGIYALYIFSPQEQPRHISSAAACSSAGASASATASEAGSWQWSSLLQISSSASWASCDSTSTQNHCKIIHLCKIPLSFRWNSHSRKGTVLLQIHHKATSQSCPIMKKASIKLPWTLDNSCSCLIRLNRNFSLPQGSQPCAASAFMVSKCFKQQLPGILMHYHWPDTCLPATPKNSQDTSHL